MSKPVLATTSLAGCFGCHMSLLDIDDRIFDLIELVEFNKSPLDDIKTFTKECDIGLIEGGCCNSENIEVLKDFRKNCKILVSVGECAIMGGLPALRNGISIKECLEEAYLNGPTVGENTEKIMPNDNELPMLLDKVYPCHEIVKIDYYLPGCPPRADLIWNTLVTLLTGDTLELPYEVVKFDSQDIDMTKKITIDPVTRVEGHGKVTIHLDDQNNVDYTRLHIVEFRGFERFVQGRPYWEAPVLVQRLCGICPVSHHLAAAKALDVIVGAGTGEGLTPTGEKMRRLMQYGQIFQSHSLHFFYLVSPDLLFGIDADPAIRNVIGVAMEHKELAVQGIMMRKFGQEIIRATAGKKIHGTGAIPGGINKHLSPEDKEAFLNGADPLNIDQMIAWSQGALDFFKDYYAKNRSFIDNFAVFPSSHLSLVRKDGAMDLYHGVLRAVDAEGNKILDDVDYQDYEQYIEEEVRSWSYMKFPYLKHLGKEKGWYRVGPLARLNTSDFIPTPLAQEEFEHYKALTHGKPNGHCLHYHYARLIETLHAAEMMKELLNDPDLMAGELVTTGTKVNKGIGLIEAPRGTLFHHYEINEHDQITLANLIVSTTNNNEPMNQSVNQVAHSWMDGQPEITEPMMNAVEVAIRAYDPCLSCATHALGKMPLELTLFDAEGKLLDTKRT